jgi:ketosteroid isomerase-like protein
MLRLLVPLLLGLAIGSCARSPARAPASPAQPLQAPETELAARLRAQADAWDLAILRKDRAAIAANMADSFMQIGSDGAVADKAKFLEGITSEKLAISPYTVEEFRARMYGDTALITGRTDMHGSWDGKPFRSHYRFTDTYVREADGAWRVVNVQTTEIAE